MQFSVEPLATVVTTLSDAHRTRVDGVIGPVNAATQHATSLRANAAHAQRIGDTPVSRTSPHASNAAKAA